MQWLVYDVWLPNINICTLFLICLFVYDVFWVFFSERFFGENVMWIRKLLLFFQKTSYFYFSRKLPIFIFPECYVSFLLNLFFQKTYTPYTLIFMWIRSTITTTSDL
ncbi:hypothetical protein ZOSMA_188G00020 [Zostera marina]|uniref:Uncharacterized protein n=1 Tax=Zostera marina TaxID=29655 RepID=A0A0K9PQ90_ZOSMR|nr:hypothetical protein ZOSMA_188G00020 [Zostera marina]